MIKTVWLGGFHLFSWGFCLAHKSETPHPILSRKKAPNIKKINNNNKTFF